MFDSLYVKVAPDSISDTSYTTQFVSLIIRTIKNPEFVIFVATGFFVLIVLKLILEYKRYNPKAKSDQLHPSYCTKFLYFIISLANTVSSHLLDYIVIMLLFFIALLSQEPNYTVQDVILALLAAIVGMLILIAARRIYETATKTEKAVSNAGKIAHNLEQSTFDIERHSESIIDSASIILGLQELRQDDKYGKKLVTAMTSMSEGWVEQIKHNSILNPFFLMYLREEAFDINKSMVVTNLRIFSLSLPYLVYQHILNCEQSSRKAVIFTTSSILPEEWFFTHEKDGKYAPYIPLHLWLYRELIRVIVKSDSAIIARVSPESDYTEKLLHDHTILDSSLAITQDMLNNEFESYKSLIKSTMVSMTDISEAVACHIEEDNLAYTGAILSSIQDVTSQIEDLHEKIRHHIGSLCKGNHKICKINAEEPFICIRKDKISNIIDYIYHSIDNVHNKQSYKKNVADDFKMDEFKTKDGLTGDNELIKAIGCILCAYYGETKKKKIMLSNLKERFQSDYHTKDFYRYKLLKDIKRNYILIGSVKKPLPDNYTINQLYRESKIDWNLVLETKISTNTGTTKFEFIVNNEHNQHTVNNYVEEFFSLFLGLPVN